MASVCTCTDSPTNPGIPICTLDKDKIKIQTGNESTVLDHVGTWRRESDRYVLASCPSGHALDRIAQECIPCAPEGVYVVEDGEGSSFCRACPAGADCRHGEFLRGKDGAVFKRIGQDLILQTCELAGYMLTNKSKQLVNSTEVLVFSHDVQECRRCALNQYFVYSSNGECIRCPVGADCNGEGPLTPKVPGSIFQEDFDDDGQTTHRMRISYCPQGFVKVFDEKDSLKDECVMCPTNTYLVTDQAAVTAAREAVAQCFECPPQATCNGGSHVALGKGWWRNFDLDARASQGRRSGRNLAEGQVMAFRCPPEMCNGGVLNNCSEGHEGPLCSICSKNWVRTAAGKCSNCGAPSADKTMRTSLAIAGLTLLALVLWYLFSLRALLAPYLADLAMRCGCGFLLKERRKNPMFAKLQGISPHLPTCPPPPAPYPLVTPKCSRVSPCFTLVILPPDLTALPADLCVIFLFPTFRHLQDHHHCTPDQHLLSQVPALPIESWSSDRSRSLMWPGLSVQQLSRRVAGCVHHRYAKPGVLQDGSPFAAWPRMHRRGLRLQGDANHQDCRADRRGRVSRTSFDLRPLAPVAGRRQ